MHHHLSLRSKLIIMISVMASLFLVALDQTIVSTALGKIVEEFNAFSSLTWVVTAYLITTTITTPIAGKMSDMFGRRNVILTGVGIFTLGSFLSGMSGDINQLIIWRAFQGIGGGIIMANAFTIVGDLFAARERGKWQGMIGAVFGISSLIGPLLGGFLTESHTILGLVTDWRWTFFINIPVGIAALAIIAIFCPPLKHENKPKIDFVGAGLLAVILATIVLAVDNTEQIFANLLDSTGLSLGGLRLIMAAIIVVATALFVFVEKRVKEPILDLRFFKNRNFLILLGIAIAVGAGMMGSILYLTQFNQQVFGATPTQSGLMLMPMIVGLMAASILVGRLVSKTGAYKRFMVAGFTIATASMAMLLTLTPESSFLQEAVIMVFVGVGIGAGMPLMAIATQNEFEQKDLGMATSSNQLFRGLGSTIGVAIFGSMLTLSLTNSLGDMSHNSYIQSLQKMPAASQAFGDLTDANTLLNLNMPDTRNKIAEGADKAIDSMHLPEAVKTQQKDAFSKQQDEYSDKIVNAYADGMHQIFMIAAIVMAVGLVLSLTIKERPLQAASAEVTPGEL
ncbi:MAG TPA: MDR family MFS transporter [Candidatus Saccharimonadales bacterium]|nr:MDR family MFS transporter [Candidatus Saccharimonadales bacterium]